MAIEFAPLRREDFPLLGRWLAASHVEPRWREAYDPASVEARYGPVVDGDEPTEAFLLVREGEPIGFIQRYRLDDNPAWKHTLEPASVPHPSVGIDYLIGDERLLGRGVGPAVIDRFVRDTWRHHQHVVAAVADVAQDNRRSWRAIEKAGFRRVWEGTLASDDPSDEGPSYVYVRRRNDKT